MTDAPVIDTAFLAAAAAAELEDWGPLEEATSAETPMTTRGRTIWSAGDNSGAEAGIWECTAGPSYWVQEETEVVYLLSGSMTVTPDDGKPERVPRSVHQPPKRATRPVSPARV